MRHMLNSAAVALAGGLLAATPALADFSATATTDLNIRTGPGPQFQVVGSIKALEPASVRGCLADRKWCEISYNGITGWAHSDYLSSDFSGEQVVISTAPATVEVPTVQFDEQSANATVGATGGAITGALIGGPIGAVIGGVTGAAIGSSVKPPEQVRTYVRSNQVEPVYLEGEVVVGAGVPDAVKLSTVPDYEYDYVYVNGQPVLVDPGTRKIVYVYRQP